MYSLCIFLTTLALAYGAINPSNCGKRPLNLGREASEKLVGGTVAKVGDWGWQVSITNNGNHFCGGVLIDNQWVLCAAHCFTATQNLATLRVRFGAHDISITEPWVTSVGVSKLFRHVSYNANNFANDISILKLATPVTYDDYYILPSCVPTSGTPTYEATKAVATGWGTNRINGALSRYLQEVEVDILTNARCTTKYGAALFNGNLQVCATETGANLGPCQGDSGGPLVVQDSNGNWNILGLISWGYDCGQGGVYTRVSGYLSWIQNIMNTQ